MNVLDRTFKVSLMLKGLDGVLELIGGFFLLLASPNQIDGLARFLTRHELAEDPRDFVANHLMHYANALTVSASLFAAIYLLLHAVVKVVLVLAVLLDKLWAYPWMVAFLVVFIVYQMTVSFSLGLLLLTLFDLFIVWLTLLEYRRRRFGRRGPARTVARMRQS